MPVFTAIAAFVTEAVIAAGASAFWGAVAGFAARTVLTIGLTKLIANRTGSSAAGTQDSGARVQLPPASNNKLPVVYGSAYIAPVITDAKISEDQKTMWYVCALSEVTNYGADTFTFGDIYWGGNKCIFGDLGDTGKVTSFEINSTPTTYDDKINGKIWIYRFPNGSSSGIDTGVSNAITLLSDSAIPSDERWNQGIYTANGQSASMTNTAFIVVKVIFDRDAGTTGLGQLNVQLTNSRTRPGDVIAEYLVNDVYGCAVPANRINYMSISILNDYSDELITYNNNGSPATQPRYRINGPVNTGDNCLNNLQQLVDCCDSWLQYSELTGEWTVVINKPYSWDGTTIGDLYDVTNYNLVGGINLNPIDLNGSYNQLEVQFPDSQANDQTNYDRIDLVDYVPGVISPNEPQNLLTVQFNQVNNYIQAVYLGLRRMLQSREDLTIDFFLDYSGIQLQAGDVIRIPFEPYGWDTLNGGYGKLFRVSQVQEAKVTDGSLGARITAFEYNDTVYVDDPIDNFVPSTNTGLKDPNVIGTPDAPTVVLDLANTMNSMNITGTVPSPGLVLYMDFNYGNTSNSQQHQFYTRVNNANGLPLTANSNVSINSTDLPAGNLYFSVTARNHSVGVRSNSSSIVVWPGNGVSTYDVANNTGGIANTNIKDNTILSNNIANNTILSNNIANNTILSNNIANNTILANNVANFTLTSNTMSNTGVTAGSYTTVNITVDDAGRVTSASNGTPGISGVTVQGNSNTVVNTATTLNFTGNAVTVSNVGNVATMTITKANVGVDVARAGTTIVTGATELNFSANFTVTSTGTTANIDVSGGTTGWPLKLLNTRGFITGSGPSPYLNAFTYSGRNRSMYIPGLTAWDANRSVISYTQGTGDWDPFFQSTSSTANDFLTNSSGPLDPNLARFQQIGTFTSPGILQTTDGLHGWVEVLGQGGYSDTGNYQYQCTGSVQLVANTDCNVQIGGAASYWYPNAYYLGSFLDWTTVQTIQLVANRPQMVNFNFYASGKHLSDESGTYANITVQGLTAVVKNPNSGVDIYVTQGEGLFYTNSVNGVIYVNA